MKKNNSLRRTNKNHIIRKEHEEVNTFFEEHILNIRSMATHFQLLLLSADPIQFAPKKK